MTALEVALGVAVLALAGAVLVLATRGGDGESTIDDEAIERSVDRAIADLDLDRTAGEIETHAREMKAFHSDVSKLLRTPGARGGFGEVQLETILADALPEDLHNREQELQKLTRALDPGHRGGRPGLPRPR
jgi:DNA recombination protein RmuC